MKIHCLGTTGYHPSETRHTACYFLPADGIVLDAGSGMFRLTPLIQTERLDILLSHVHLDHVIGLTFLLDILHQRPVDEVVVWGEADKLQAVRQHLFHPLLFPVAAPVRWQPVDDLNQWTLGRSGRVQVTQRAQEHPGGSLAYRLQWSQSDGDGSDDIDQSAKHKTLVYATDTTGDRSAAMQHWVQGADLLMHECYFRDADRKWAKKTGHCWTSRAAQIAAQADVGQLLLTHISPLASGDDPLDLAAARAIFPRTTVAEDHQIIEF